MGQLYITHSEYENGHYTFKKYCSRISEETAVEAAELNPAAQTNTISLSRPRNT
jgi:hypothetical protein